MARPNSIEDSKRQEMLFPAALLERVDDWRFLNRVNGRSEAIRRLVEIGLEVAAGSSAASETKRNRSPT